MKWSQHIQRFEDHQRQRALPNVGLFFHRSILWVSNRNHSALLLNCNVPLQDVSLRRSYHEDTKKLVRGVGQEPRFRAVTWWGLRAIMRFSTHFRGDCDEAHAAAGSVLRLTLLGRRPTATTF